MHRLPCLILATCCTLLAAAQGPRERPRYLLLALDLDHDGTLSAAEIADAPATLRALDRNADGQLTPDELEAPRNDAGATPDDLVQQLMAFDHAQKGFLVPADLPERMRDLFTRADLDHDGKLTPDEIRRRSAHTGTPNGRPGVPGSAAGNMRQDPILNALDADHDGLISPAEIAAASTSLLTLDANHDGMISPNEMRVRQPTPGERAAHVLEENDTDKDGRLSPEEAPEFLRPRFVELDLNHDGFLDRSELLPFFAAPRPAPQPAPQSAPPSGDRP